MGSDLPPLEAGRFFPSSSEFSFGFIISVLGTPFDAGGSSVHSDMHSGMVWLIVHSHVTWLWAGKTVSSLHN